MTRMIGTVGILASVCILACCDDNTNNSEEKPPCVKRFAPSAENDFKDYPEGTDNTANLSEDCHVKGGLPEEQCVFDVVVTRNAAVCIAQDAGLATGIKEIQAWTVFHGKFSRPVWNVMNTLLMESDGRTSGEVYSIDGETGEILGKSNWDATP